MDFYDCDKNFFGPRVLLNCPGCKNSYGCGKSYRVKII